VPTEEDFDAATLVEVLKHLPEDLKRSSIEEIHRGLRDDGVLLLTTPHRGWFAWLDPMDLKRRLRLTTGKGHKHYSLEEIRHPLDGLFSIKTIHRSSLVLHPISTCLGVGNNKRWRHLRSGQSDWNSRHD